MNSQGKTLKSIDADRNVAFIIGNGKSRKDLSLSSLYEYGAIFGCNALYRDFWPDYLVAIDPGIIREINTSEFPKSRIIIPPLNEQFEPGELYGFAPGSVVNIRSNAGMNAMMEAIKLRQTALFVIGFDFIIDTEEYTQSNIYDQTKNYGPETRCDLEGSNRRMNYMNWFIKNNPTIDFYFVFPKGIPLKIFAETNNVNICNIDEMEKLLEEYKCLRPF
jgi:hypothetical protein